LVAVGAGAQEVKYRTLGHTGLIVSEVALGSMQFGGKMNMGNLGQEDTSRMVRLALDRGINFIDTADVYSLGESETLLGNALKGIREEIVLATKVRLPMGENFNRSGATRVNIMREVEGSLDRLQTDYIDLYRCTDGTATRRSRRPCARLTTLCARERSAMSGSPISCHGRRPLLSCCRSAWGWRDM
jgi:aryl-alcohol dehydrogenase-like predicted oxidoreductase